MVRLTRLRELRQRRFLSQAELAELAGVTRNTIVRLELGTTEPQGRTIRRIAEALRVSPEALIGEPDPRPGRS